MNSEVESKFYFCIFQLSFTNFPPNPQSIFLHKTFFSRFSLIFCIKFSTFSIQEKYSKTFKNEKIVRKIFECCRFFYCFFFAMKSFWIFPPLYYFIYELEKSKTISTWKSSFSCHSICLIKNLWALFWVCIMKS